MKYNDILTDNDSDIASLFSQFFKSTYSTDDYDNSFNYNCDIPSSNFPIPSIDAAVILQYIESLKPSTKAGSDNIPTYLLINCSLSIHIPLFFLFSLSLKLSYFPSIWKSSYIIPLHKSGSRNDVTNYRGIAKLSDIPKLFEHIISDQLSSSFANCISEQQHGFLKGRSIVTNLLEFIRKFSMGLKMDTKLTLFILILAKPLILLIILY